MLIYVEIIRNDRFWIYIFYFILMYLSNISWTRAAALCAATFGRAREYGLIIIFSF